MDVRALFDQIRKFDTPTICNALEVVRAAFTMASRGSFSAAFPAPAHRGLCEDCDVRSWEPYDAAEETSFSATTSTLRSRTSRAFP
jgi:hypothetical protein